MTQCICSITVTALITVMALPAWGQQYLLYTPQPVASGQKVSSQEGVLVQEVEIKKGDTLYALSRKFSGNGMYYPQILLFNSIKNPNLIYPGNALKIPVTHKSKDTGDSKAPLKTEAQPSPARQPAGSAPVLSSNTDLSLNDLKAAGAGNNLVSRIKRKTAVLGKKKPSKKYPAVKIPSARSAAAPKGAAAADGQKLFEAAVKAYRRDDCGAALELLDRYLADNPGSPLAADANLYKAECYLKLSAQ